MTVPLSEMERELVEALEFAQGVLLMLTEPQSIRSTTVHHAWAQAVAAEAKARVVIARARQTATSAEGGEG